MTPCTCGNIPAMSDNFCAECGAIVQLDTWQPSYERWRHGGWYVYGTRYPSGACGCVSRNYDDKQWRIVCDPRPNAYERYTYKTRDEAARAERALVSGPHANPYYKNTRDAFTNCNYTPEAAAYELASRTH